MRIDAIDLQIQSLIQERAGFARLVGAAKGPLKAAVEYYRPEREAQVLRRVVDRNEGPLSDEVLVRLFREVMSACLAQQEPLRIGYLGPEGTFSQQAVHKHFGHSAHGLPLSTIEEVFEEVEAGNADFGVVPVENSGQGTIQSTLDMFLTSTLKICGEVELRVHQYLLSRTGRIEDVERVYSHPQSLAQCKSWLRQHLPNAERAAGGEQRRGGASLAHRRRRRGDRGRIGRQGLRAQGRGRPDRGPARQHHALPGAGAQPLPGLGPRPHVVAGVGARPARRAVQRAAPARRARHQHEPDRIASGAPGQVGSTPSSSTSRATSRTRRCRRCWANWASSPTRCAILGSYPVAVL